MKNLSFLSNLTIAAFLALSCNNNPSKTNSKKQIVKEKIQLNNVTTNTDTFKETQSKVVINEVVSNKDTFNKNKKYFKKANNEIKQAPKHNSPDQSQIDSIKKEKRKIKNKLQELN